MQRRANNQQLSPCCCGVTRLWLSSTVQSSWLLLSLLSADVWMLFIFAWHGIHGNFLEKNNTRQHWGGFFKSKRGRVTGSPSPSSRGNRGKKRIFTSCFTTYLLRHFSFVILVKFLFIVFTFLFFIFFFWRWLPCASTFTSTRYDRKSGAKPTEKNENNVTHK